MTREAGTRRPLPRLWRVEIAGIGYTYNGWRTGSKPLPTRDRPELLTESSEFRETVERFPS
ncbi:hypothetical protein NITHO_5150003 [Nitrolancea hollandica Lb]|uniref:Uncharacterized protein n=1 Tax=Nitrolancea hollandica Lb TaxID=1129897 RepID=I4ELJ3_9BACT|nr:hypothetical protein NITHO_5150003 [Nitrolancea hollandica Lb]